MYALRLGFPQSRMLFALPADISLTILADWLGRLIDLVRLDAACTGRVRPAYLALIRELTVPDRFASRAHLHKDMDSAGCVKWINTRMLRIRYLCVDAAGAASGTMINSRCLSKVSSFQIHSQAPVNTLTLKKLLDLLPALTSFDASCFQAVDEGYLQVLANRPVTLQVLYLAPTMGDGSNLPLIFNSYGATLVTIDLGGALIEDALLAEMSATCHALVNIELHAQLLTNNAVLAHFASSAFPCLMRLNLKDEASQGVYPDTALIAICRAHPHLTYLKLQGKFSTSFTSCAVVLSLCPQIDFIRTSAYKYDVQKHCSLHVYARTPETVLCAELRRIIAAHRAVNMFNYCYMGVSDSCFDEILDICGGEALLSLSLTLDGVCSATLCRLALLCPNMNSIAFYSCTTVCDAFLKAVADNCRKLTMFTVLGAELITNQGMEHFLQAVGANLTFLNVAECVQLTDITMASVKAHCPKLKFLFTAGTGVTMEWTPA